MKFISIIDKYWVAFLGLVFIIAAGAILFISIGQPVWFDEGYSILLAKNNFGELLSLTAVDAHPPLYYLLLKVWGDLFGFTELTLRSLSAILMGGAIVVALSIIRRVFSTKIALATAPFLLLAPFLLRYGYEIRMYALATFIAVSATYALVRAQAAKGWKWWAVYAAFVALGMYTLYLMAAVWLAHFVWLLVVTIRSRKSHKLPFWRWSWLYAFAAAVVLFLPYIFTFIHQLLNSALPGMGGAITPTQLVNIASIFTLYIPEWAISGWVSVFFVAAIIFAAVLGTFAYRTLPATQKKYFMLFVALAVVPLLFYTLTSLPPSKPIFIVRYMAHSALFIYALLGLSVALAVFNKEPSRKKALYRAGASVVILLVLVSGVMTLQKTGNFNFERMQQPLTYDVRGAIDCNADTTIVADDPYTYIDAVYYFDHCDVRFFSEKNVEYKGGYAMLNNSDARVANPETLTTKTIVHLRWSGADQQYTPGNRYILVSSQTFDKQVVDTYAIIAE